MVKKGYVLWTTILVLVFPPTISCLPSLLPVLIILFVVIYPLEIDPCWIRILKRKICHTQQINCDGLKMEAFSRWLSGKESACQCRRCKRPGFNPWVGKIPQRRIWQPTPVYPCQDMEQTYVVIDRWQIKEYERKCFISSICITRP